MHNSPNVNTVPVYDTVEQQTGNTRHLQENISMLILYQTVFVGLFS